MIVLTALATIDTHHALTTVSVREIVERTNALSEITPPAPLEVSLAVGGVAPLSLPDLDGAFQDYLDFTRDRHLQKSESQKKMATAKRNDNQKLSEDSIWQWQMPTDE